MKAITLTQPWATLVAIGAKRIETRPWSTKYRGPLAIHAGKGIGPVGRRRDMISLCTSSPFAEALDAAGIWPFSAIDHFPYGKIVAICTLSHVNAIYNDTIHTDNRGHAFTYTELRHGGLPDRLWIDEPERSFGDYSPGRYAWLLSDVKPLPEPIPAKGALSLWEWNQ